VLETTTTALSQEDFHVPTLTEKKHSAGSSYLSLGDDTWKTENFMSLDRSNFVDGKGGWLEAPCRHQFTDPLTPHHAGQPSQTHGLCLVFFHQNNHLFLKVTPFTKSVSLLRRDICTQGMRIDATIKDLCIGNFWIGRVIQFRLSKSINYNSSESCILITLNFERFPIKENQFWITSLAFSTFGQKPLQKPTRRSKSHLCI
jgi:hypothetical protein